MLRNSQAAHTDVLSPSRIYALSGLLLDHGKPVHYLFFGCSAGRSKTFMEV
jgi:hypothetical protein